MVRGSSVHELVRLGTAIIGLIALANGLVFAQGSTAAISGLTRDTTGALVPGVTITVKHLESGLTRTTVTNENGGYSVQFLPVGPYELTTDMPGFKQQVRRGIDLSVAQEAMVNLTLEVGNLSDGGGAARQRDAQFDVWIDHRATDKRAASQRAQL